VIGKIADVDAVELDVAGTGKLPSAVAAGGGRYRVLVPPSCCMRWLVAGRRDAERADWTPGAFSCCGCSAPTSRGAPHAGCGGALTALVAAALALLLARAGWVWLDTQLVSMMGCIPRRSDSSGQRRMAGRVVAAATLTGALVDRWGAWGCGRSGPRPPPSVRFKVCAHTRANANMDRGRYRGSPID